MNKRLEIDQLADEDLGTDGISKNSEGLAPGFVPDQNNYFLIG